MAWPGLLAAAVTRMADAALRNSVHRGGMEILYMPLPVTVMKTVKTFLQVAVERIGDATAGIILFFYSLVFPERYIAYVHFVCVALIFVWLLAVTLLRVRYLQIVRSGSRSYKTGSETETLKRRDIGVASEERTLR
jgi:AAA family ATP:ADP antiporter